MFKVFTGAGHSYVGCSERLANQFFDAATKVGLCALMCRREGNGSWVEIREFIPADDRTWKTLAIGMAAHLENLERHCSVQTGKTGAAHAREGVELREAGRKLIAMARAALPTSLPEGE